jgi:hypothetical protein
LDRRGSGISYIVRDANNSPVAYVSNPVLGDYLDRECKAMKIELGEMEIVAGVKVKS